MLFNLKDHGSPSFGSSWHAYVKFPAYTLPHLYWKEHHCYHYCKRLQQICQGFLPKRSLIHRIFLEVPLNLGLK